MQSKQLFSIKHRLNSKEGRDSVKQYLESNTPLLNKIEKQVKEELNKVTPKI